LQAKPPKLSSLKKELLKERVDAWAKKQQQSLAKAGESQAVGAGAGAGDDGGSTSSSSDPDAVDDESIDEDATSDDDTDALLADSSAAANSGVGDGGAAAGGGMNGGSGNDDDEGVRDFYGTGTSVEVPVITGRTSARAIQAAYPRLASGDVLPFVDQVRSAVLLCCWTAT
jgi:hypothetical protein